VSGRAPRLPAHARAAAPQATGKERVVCLTAERRTKRRGFKGSLHLCKAAAKGYQARSPPPGPPPHGFPEPRGRGRGRGRKARCTWTYPWAAAGAPRGRGARAQVRKTWQLKHLTRLEAIEEEGGEGGLAAVELSFVNTTFTSETRLALRGEAPAALVDLLGALYLFCRCGPWPRRARARAPPPPRRRPRPRRPGWRGWRARLRCALVPVLRPGERRRR